MKEQSESKNNGAAPGVVRRAITFPSGLYLDMKDENTKSQRKGIKRNTEEEIISLIADGIKFRNFMDNLDHMESQLKSDPNPVEIHERSVKLIRSIMAIM